MEWKDKSVDWVPLKDLKQSNLVELAEYSMENEISDEPDFSWWFKETLHRRDRIFQGKIPVWLTSHKFGMRVPKTVKEAYDIER